MLSPKLPLRLVISSPWKEDRAMAIGNMHKNFVKDRACGSGDTPVDRQTDRQTDTRPSQYFATAPAGKVTKYSISHNNGLAIIDEDNK